MASNDLKTFWREQLASARDHYLKDLEALSDEQAGASPGGKARSALDFSYEVSFINRRLAKRLRSEAVEPIQMGPFLTAPENLRTRGAIAADLRESFDEVLEAWDALPEDVSSHMVKFGEGEVPVWQVASFGHMHARYHDGQLNLLQAINGDEEVHW